MAALLGLAWAGLTAHANDSPDDLTELSLEELHAVSISAASKRAEPLFETPAAVSVLLPVDVRRAGANSIAEALRLVPGLHVIDQLPEHWSVGVRGGNGLQSTKLLVLVDGRSVYGPFYGGVEWANADVSLEDLARIEVVRGPGTTLWGANAVNGVINVISKDARDTQGGVISVRAGTAEPASAYVREGVQLGGQSWARVYVSSRNSQGALGPLGDDPKGGYSELRAGARVDRELGDRFRLTLQADSLQSKRRIDADPSSHRLASVQSRLQGRDVAGGELQLQVYYDTTTDRVGRGDFGGEESVPFALDGDTRNFDFDLSHHLHLGNKHDVIWGGGARFTDDAVQSTENLRVQQPRRRSWLFNYFVQDEIALTPRQLRLTLGTKLEHHQTVGWQLLPNARLAWLPNAQNTLWTAVSRAARAPSRSEREAQLTLARLPATAGLPPVRVEAWSDPNFGCEINYAYEAGWRWRPTARFQTDATVYCFDYHHARSLDTTTSFDPGPPAEWVQRFTLTNGASARTEGAELSWTWRPSDRWELGGGVSRAVARTWSVAANPLVASDYVIPSWLWHLRSWWQLPRDFEFSTTLYGVGENRDARTPAYLRWDVQLLWRPVAPLEFALGAQNVGDPSHDETIVGDVSPHLEVRRNLYGRVQWRF